MSKMKEIGVAVLGFGTVGAGVVETLQKNGGLLAERLAFGNGASDHRQRHENRQRQHQHDREFQGKPHVRTSGCGARMLVPACVEAMAPR